MKSVYFPKRMFFIPFHLERAVEVILILLTLTVFSVFAGEDIQQINGEDSRKLVKQAEKLARKGKLPEAEKLLRRALEINANSSDAKLNLAHILVKQRHLLEAYDLAFSVVKNEPKNSFAYAVLGVTMLNAGNFREAERAIIISLKLDRKQALAWAGLGMLDFYENRINKSLESLRMATYQDSEEPDYLFTLGQVSARAEQYKEAADAYRQYLSISNDSDTDRRDRIKGLIDFLSYLGNQQLLYDVAGAEKTKVDFELIGNRPVINLKINGKDDVLRFVLDTGSGISVVSDKTAKRLNIKSVARGGKARGIGGDGKFEIVYGFLRSVSIGEAKIKNVPVYIRQFHQINEGIDGYIGLSLISKFLTTIDYGRQTFDLERKNSLAFKSFGKDSLSLPLRLTSSGFLSGEVQLEGVQVPLNFIVDTGASVSVISNQLANTGAMGQFIKNEKMRVVGSAGVTEDVPSYLLPRVTFGNHSRESITAIRLDLDLINETSGFEQAGILGGNFLKNYCLTFDFENSKVIFVPINK